MIGRCATKILLLCTPALLCAAQVGSAQQWQGNGSYYQQPNVQQYAQPNAQRAYYQVPSYYQANQQPIQRVQATSPSYGGYPNSAYPPSSYYYYPRMPQNLYYPGVPSGGWNFNYTPPNPIVPSQSSYNLPIYASPYLPSGNVPAPTSWPAPTAKTYPLPNEGPLVERTPLVPPTPFHRPTKDTLWFNADYTMGFLRPMRTTPLVTIGDPDRPRQGALGEPGTQVIYGGNSIDLGMYSGARVSTGMFLDCANRFSFEIAGFWMIQRTQAFFKSSDAAGIPLIARPIYRTADDEPFREGALTFSFPGSFAGSVGVDTKSNLVGIEFNGRYHTYTQGRLHADFLTGFRFMRLSEQIEFQDRFAPIAFPSDLTYLGIPLNPGESLTDTDLFKTSNQFFGPQIGFRANWEWPWCSLGGFAKIGLGVTEQRVKIDGSTTLIAPAGNQTTAGGTLALPSNIGTYSRTVFGIVPEFGINCGVDVTDHIRMKLGYSLLLWNHVVRPTTQIDRNINPAQSPHSPSFGQVSGPANPSFQFRDEFFWSHFFNIGIEARY